MYAEVIYVYKSEQPLCRIAAGDDHLRRHQHDGVRILLELAGLVITEYRVRVIVEIVYKLLAHVLKV